MIRHDKQTTTISRSGRAGRWTTLTLTLLALGSCDFEVTNPGPVQDTFLNDSDAYLAIVNGAGRDLAEGLNYVAYHGSMPTRELFPTGGTGQFGISIRNADGFLDPQEQNQPWNLMQRARWTAEDGLRRFEENMEPATFQNSELVAEIALWAGYSNRTLGENMCQAIIDEGPIQPRETFLTRAEGHFTRAIEVGGAAGVSEVVTSARAGRAAVRMHLGDWSGALADAASVPDDFVFAMPYYNRGNLDEYNRIGYAVGNEPYKTNTVWNTVYEDYFLDSGDPRVAWEDTGLPGDGGLACCGSVPFYRQLKFDREGDMNLSSGAEMRLIEAEGALVDGDWESALALINAIRADHGVAARTASSAAETWTHLKRERGIALWLEGRRLGDLYRWDAAGTPGEMDPLEVVGDESYLLNQDLCFPIPDSERDTNPNVS